MTVKQVIVMRKDLNMRKGKMIAQGSHASMAFLTNSMRRPFAQETILRDLQVANLSEVEKEWILGSFIKIVLYVDSEVDLLAVADAAYEAGVICHLIKDDGRTEFKGVPTYTCLALGPDNADRIDPITGHLELL